MSMTLQDARNSHPPSDEDVISAVQKGEQPSTEAFVRSNTPWMLNVAQRILQDRSAAEDSVQSAFVQVFQRLDTFRGDSSLRTWMQRIVVNEALAVLRKQERLRETPIDTLLPEFDGHGCRIEDRWQLAETPESLAMSTEVTDKVVAAIETLPDAYRVVLLLRDIEGYSTAETGAALGLEVSNVKVRLHRARAALKKLLTPVFAAEDL